MTVDRWISVISLLVTLCGFIIAIYQIVQSRTAAEHAQKAAEDTRRAVQRFDLISELFTLITTIDEIKRLHRVSAWSHLVERYSACRRLISSIRESIAPEDEDSLSLLQKMMTRVSSLEEKIERCLETKGTFPEYSQINKQLSEDRDRLNSMASVIRQTKENESRRSIHGH